MKNILVTGGAGFIGSHTCLTLLEKGYNLYVIDSFVNSSPKSLDKILEINISKKDYFRKKLKVFEGDLRDINFLENVFLEITKNNKKLDGVIHFAGLKSVSDSINQSLEYWKVNVYGTINLLEIMDRYNCLTMVFSSSATVYASSGNKLLSENSPIKPTNPYGASKLTIELLLNNLFNDSNKNTKFASLRYFNPIGAHSSGLIGEDPRGKANNIFPLIINTAMGIQKELKIYGNDWPSNDGTPIRDYIHVMDLAEVHIQVLENLINSEPKYLKLNVGTGLGTSVLNLVKTFEKVNNVKVPYLFANRRCGDECFVVADNSFLKSEFNIYPQRSLEDMCRDGWKWKTLNPNGF